MCMCTCMCMRLTVDACMCMCTCMCMRLYVCEGKERDKNRDSVRKRNGSRWRQERRERDKERDSVRKRNASVRKRNGSSVRDGQREKHVRHDKETAWERGTVADGDRERQTDCNRQFEYGQITADRLDTERGSRLQQTDYMGKRNGDKQIDNSNSQTALASGHLSPKSGYKQSQPRPGDGQRRPCPVHPHLGGVFEGALAPPKVHLPPQIFSQGAFATPRFFHKVHLPPPELFVFFSCHAPRSRVGHGLVTGCHGLALCKKAKKTLQL